MDDFLVTLIYIVTNWPGSRTSWLCKESGLSGIEVWSINENNFWTIKLHKKTCQHQYIQNYHRPNARNNIINDIFAYISRLNLSWLLSRWTNTNSLKTASTTYKKKIKKILTEINRHHKIYTQICKNLQLSDFRFPYHP